MDFKKLDKGKFPESGWRTLEDYCFRTGTGECVQSLGSPQGVMCYISFLGLLRNKVTKAGYLKEQKCILSEFWSLEVYSQGMGEGARLLKPVGDTLSLPS